MSTQIAFPLCDGQILSIRIATEPGAISLDEVRDGSILWGFDAFLGDRPAKNKFCEEVLAWPFRKHKSLRNVRLEVSTAEQQRGTGNSWLGESFGLACAIAFHCSQADNQKTQPFIVATGVIRRVDNNLFVDPVEASEPFTQKLNGVLSCAPDYFIYPSRQPLSPGHHDQLLLLQHNGTTVLAVDSLEQVCDYGICPSMQNSSAADTSHLDLESPWRKAEEYEPISGQDGLDPLTNHNERPVSADSQSLYKDVDQTDSGTNHLRPSGLVGAEQWSDRSTQQPSQTRRIYGLGKLLVPFLAALAVYLMWPLFMGLVHGKTSTDNILSESEIGELKAAIRNSELIQQYEEKNTHKAFAFSDSGAGGWTHNILTSDMAARISLEICRSHNHSQELDFPCRVVNVDGAWLSNYEPAELPESIVGKAHLTESSALKFYEQNYSKIPHNKVLAASLSGVYSAQDDPGLSTAWLGINALADCRKRNQLLEKAYPCRIINTDGEWSHLPATTD